MSLYEFISLDGQEQAEEVWQGEFMTFREDMQHTIMLYKVHGFYVEVYYCKETNNIIRLNPFCAKARLGLYFVASLN